MEREYFDNGHVKRLDLAWIGIGRFRGRYLNRAKGATGIEVFVHSYRRCPRVLKGLFNFTLAVAKPRHRPDKVTYFSGSSNKPWEYVMIRIGWFWYGRPSPRWLRRFEEWRTSKKWDRIFQDEGLFEPTPVEGSGYDDPRIYEG